MNNGTAEIRSSRYVGYAIKNGQAVAWIHEPSASSVSTISRSVESFVRSLPAVLDSLVRCSVNLSAKSARRRRDSMTVETRP
jgi:hypothetical protein